MCRKFWHQNLRWSFTSVSSFITQRVLKIPRPSTLERYTSLTLVFILSGILHLLNDTCLGVSASESGGLLFFLSFPLGIMIEDAVQWVWNWRSMRDATSADDDRVPLWTRIIGFAWVMSWMSITAPWYSYPIQRLSSENMQLVPYSIVERLGKSAVVITLVVGLVVLKVVFRTRL
jgi:hypothetical protein